MPADKPGRAAWILKKTITALQDHGPLVDGYLDGDASRVVPNPMQSKPPEAPLYVYVQYIAKSETRMGPVGQRIRHQLQVGVVGSQPHWESNPPLHYYNIADECAEVLTEGLGHNTVPIDAGGGADQLQVGVDGDDDIAGHIHLPRRYRIQVRGV